MDLAAVTKTKRNVCCLDPVAFGRLRVVVPIGQRDIRTRLGDRVKDASYPFTVIRGKCFIRIKIGRWPNDAAGCALPL